MMTTLNTNSKWTIYYSAIDKTHMYISRMSKALFNLIFRTANYDFQRGRQRLAFRVHSGEPEELDTSMSFAF